MDLRPGAKGRFSWNSGMRTCLHGSSVGERQMKDPGLGRYPTL